MLITLLIAALVFALIYWLWTLLPLPATIKNIILAILVVIAIIWLLGFIPEGPHNRWYP